MQVDIKIVVGGHMKFKKLLIATASIVSASPLLTSVPVFASTPQPVTTTVTVSSDCSSPTAINANPLGRYSKVKLTVAYNDIDDPDDATEGETLHVYDTGNVFDQTVQVDSPTVTFPTFVTPDNDNVYGCVNGYDGDETATITAEITPGPCQPNTTLSGSSWVSQFPTSTSTSDLVDPFRTNANNFIGALQNAGASVSISATYRPPQRAYLMHYAYEIARKNMDPTDVPLRSDVAVCWVHTTSNGSVDHAASKKAAADMVKDYQIVHEPSLTSNHTQGLAIDMNISWSGTMTITDGNGKQVEIKAPRSGATNSDLWAVGASYNVYKLASDHPHWSVDGH